MKVFWENAEKTILVREFSEIWTWDEYNASVRIMREMLKEVTHKVFIIIDARRVELIPKEVLSYVNRANENLPYHVVMRILVSNKRVVRMLSSILVRLVPRNFQNFFCARTWEEAHSLIAKARQSPDAKLQSECN